MTRLYRLFDASALDGVVYQAVGGCPPPLDDLRSYVEFGIPHASRQRFRATGISVFRDRATLTRRMARFGLGTAIATLDLRQSEAVCSESGTRGHITAWVPAKVLQSLVQGDDHE